ncbi:MAG: glycogen debranching enzyme family protein [Acidobacteria bacterium]|nr:glycogen debranching enzyme family protein [Acidobacteriota bacterium]
MNGAAEWLEADGLGGFASGTVGGLRTRRYHALLLVARTPPTGRLVLVNGFDAWVRIGARTFALSSQLYAPEVVEPDGLQRLEDFTADPWPRWTFNCGGARVDQEVLVPQGAAAVALSWRLREPAPAGELMVRPFLSGRDYHALHRENPAFRFEPEGRGAWRIFRPYPDLPAVAAFANGTYAHEPLWYRNFLYQRERERGLDAIEDLAAPGTWRWDLQRGEAILILAAEGQELPAGSPAACLGIFRGAEQRRRRAFGSQLRRAADCYLVRRDGGKTIVAGYPWFTDWGRDTFIALRGLCLAVGRAEAAAAILLAWARTVSQGMLPNRFPDSGETAEYNSVDASLWFVVAVDALLRAAPGAAGGAAGVGGGTWQLGAAERQALLDAVEAILDGYAAGTRYGIRADADGLLTAGEPGSQLTWMDARVDGNPVTSRCGKPVEVQALWIHALSVGAAGAAQPSPAARWRGLWERARASFAARFWNEAAGCLYDVVDVDHRPGAVDAAMRPNQILAVGGLPVCLLPPERARRVVDAVEKKLWTPLGLRTLAPGEPGYRGRYEGDPRSRDGAYHQGTAWPWLLGPFVEAWVRVRGGGEEAKRQARERFLQPLGAALGDYGLGHLPEIADGDPPHAPRGCPFQAWSMGELLRLSFQLLS